MMISKDSMNIASNTFENVVINFSILLLIGNDGQIDSNDFLL